MEVQLFSDHYQQLAYLGEKTAYLNGSDKKWGGGRERGSPLTTWEMCPNHWAFIFVGFFVWRICTPFYPTGMIFSEIFWTYYVNRV